MSFNDLIATLSFVVSILGTIATIISAIFAYQGLKQLQAFSESSNYLIEPPAP
ncbi:hypothetical protein L207DRAFT_589192 [Hyaloscypha variabilis F]|uniref:Uncharacterized protein n=1 Tax=Hyaloscypha variabilis (strain UAMH 11265 / GT02V1 / F) TaxID=1149755 RepID=A0A2J6R536_HYAVF|nr:hypothetical protein L207DRAFT_589192 [Hyaloscypha variabilis F]